MPEYRRHPVTRRRFLAIVPAALTAICAVACGGSSDETGGREELTPRSTLQRAETTISRVAEAPAAPVALASPTVLAATAASGVSAAQTTGPTLRPTPTVKRIHVRLTVLYDNHVGLPGVAADWGFSCLVETPDHRVLFDTGADGAKLRKNAETLGADLCGVDRVVLSHAHGDHTGGLMSVLACGARPPVYVLPSFLSGFKDHVRAHTRLVEVVAHAEIVVGVHTTGEVGHGISEQALAVESGAGTIVMTGCAHPGVVEMARRAKGIGSGDIALLMGGFHLGSASREQISVILAELKTLGVRRIAPCHCSGDLARTLGREVFGEDCLLVGVGDCVEV